MWLCDGTPKHVWHQRSVNAQTVQVASCDYVWPTAPTRWGMKPRHWGKTANPPPVEHVRCAICQTVSASEHRAEARRAAGDAVKAIRAKRQGLPLPEPTPPRPYRRKKRKSPASTAWNAGMNPQLVGYRQGNVPTPAVLLDITNDSTRLHVGILRRLAAQLLHAADRLDAHARAHSLLERMQVLAAIAPRGKAVRALARELERVAMVRAEPEATLDDAPRAWRVLFAREAMRRYLDARPADAPQIGYWTLDDDMPAAAPPLPEADTAPSGDRLEPPARKDASGANLAPAIKYATEDSQPPAETASTASMAPPPCPSDECWMCTGEACLPCGLPGSSGALQPMCDHDTVERHDSTLPARAWSEAGDGFAEIAEMAMFEALPCGRDCGAGDALPECDDGRRRCARPHGHLPPCKPQDPRGRCPCCLDAMGPGSEGGAAERAPGDCRMVCSPCAAAQHDAWEEEQRERAEQARAAAEAYAARDDRKMTRAEIDALRDLVVRGAGGQMLGQVLVPSAAELDAYELARGPVDTPERIETPEDFARRFGAPREAWRDEEEDQDDAPHALDKHAGETPLARRGDTGGSQDKHALADVIDAASRHVMSAEEQEAQRQSFARGNVAVGARAATVTLDELREAGAAAAAEGVDVLDLLADDLLADENSPLDREQVKALVDERGAETAAALLEDDDFFEAPPPARIDVDAFFDDA